MTDALPAQLEEHPRVHRQQPLLTLLAFVAIVGSIAFAVLYSLPWALVAGGIGVLILVAMQLRAMGEKIVVDEDTLMVERGILSKDRTEMSLSGVRSVNVRQSFYERIVGIGTISIYTTGDEPEATISGIGSPHRIREFVNASIAGDDRTQREN